MARVVRFQEVGSPEVLRIEEFEIPPPKKGEIQIRIHALGLNRAEAMFRAGQYISAVYNPPRLVMQHGRTLESGPRLEWTMSIDFKAPAEPVRPSLGKAGTLARFGLIGVALATSAGTFAYLGGWLTPNELTPARFTDGFEEVSGVHPGFRRNHAKGVGVSGSFESNGKGVRLSKATVFQPGIVPVIGRFSLGGGQPDAADGPDAVRGLGLQFSLPDGELWRTAMIHLPVFPFRTPEAFYEQLLASKPDPKTGKPDPAKMNAFLAGHPETLEALKIIKAQPLPSGFDNSTFHSLNAFRFINGAGDSVPVRWILTPMQQFEAANTASTSQNKNYLFDASSRKSTASHCDGISLSSLANRAIPPTTPPSPGPRNGNR